MFYNYFRGSHTTTTTRYKFVPAHLYLNQFKIIYKTKTIYYSTDKCQSSDEDPFVGDTADSDINLSTPN